ncbi:SRPBCC domain-containing protein [Flavobacterium aquiphilum]|uniref:SRPBCC domain-containing protein n=1 Tax=Flavobacterium aquiphilum TaxID=3003261 RepID=UPI002480DEAA|nr:SRPBCC domain-containing protein [Flavobacterium aquiphilum]
MKLVAKASIQIQKPIKKVFEGIVNPEKMTNYFISESTGKMETGKELTWKFPEFDQRFPIKNITTKINSSVSFVWDLATIVTIALEAQPDKSTVVKVTEDGKEFNEENLKWAIGNTEGWANFLACMKAYLEYGIHLRKGAFDFMREN